MLEKPERLQLFPETTTIQNDSLFIASQDVTALAGRYGTPLYLYDRQTMDEAVRKYKAALKTHYPGATSITYAGKAFFCRAIAEWAGQQDLRVDCAGEGEIAVARAARLPASSIVAHGVNKSQAYLEAAVTQAGTIVADNQSELQRIQDVLRTPRRGARAPRPGIWLRLQPGVAVQTHHTHTQTGQADSKFGMTPEELREAAEYARSAGLSINGIHFHQGSNFRDTDPLIAAIELGVRLAREMRLPETWHFCPGGGWGTVYHEDDLPHPSIDSYVRVVARELARRCHHGGLPLPVLHLEPGRSLVARAGVAIYRVGAVKRRKHRTWLLVDGGMSDNPRYALYGAKYSCLPAKGLGRDMSEIVSIAGPFCKSGDILIEELPLPRVEEGELLAIPVSGAYQLSMSSNYNGAARPAAVWLDRGRSRLILRRETIEDLSHRQLSIL